MSLSQVEVETAIAGIRDGLQADGYDVVVQVDSDKVQVEILALEDACADCLIPKDLMQEMVQSMLPENSDPITIVYPADVAH